MNSSQRYHDHLNIVGQTTSSSEDEKRIGSFPSCSPVQRLVEPMKELSALTSAMLGISSPMENETGSIRPRVQVMLSSTPCPHRPRFVMCIPLSKLSPLPSFRTRQMTPVCQITNIKSFALTDVSKIMDSWRSREIPKKKKV